MTKMKQIIKNNIVSFILGAVIFSGIGAYAATTISSSSVTYGNTTVSAALDDLINKTKVGTATASQILSGKTALVQGSTVTGTMTNKGAWTNTPTSSGKVTIPAGYHSGSGYVDTSTVYTNAYNEGYSAKSGVVHCGSYTANGSFDITDYGLSNVDIDKFIFVPNSTFSRYNTGQQDTKGYSYEATYINFNKGSFTLSDNKVTFTLPKVTSKINGGTSTSNATTPVTSNVINIISADIYYIG